MAKDVEEQGEARQPGHLFTDAEWRLLEISTTKQEEARRALLAARDAMNDAIDETNVVLRAACSRVGHHGVVAINRETRSFRISRLEDVPGIVRKPGPVGPVEGVVVAELAATEAKQE